MVSPDDNAAKVAQQAADAKVDAAIEKLRSFTKDEVAAHKKLMLKQLEDYFEFHPREDSEPAETAISFLKAMGRGFVRSCLADPSRFDEVFKVVVDGDKADAADPDVKAELLREGRLPH